MADLIQSFLRTVGVATDVEIAHTISAYIGPVRGELRRMIEGGFVLKDEERYRLPKTAA